MATPQTNDSDVVFLHAIGLGSIGLKVPVREAFKVFCMRELYQAPIGAHAGFSSWSWLVRRLGRSFGGSPLMPISTVPLSLAPLISRKDDKNRSRTILLITSTGAAIMKPASDTTDRIYVAADSLFEQSGRSAYPTVDAVRKAARVNMNDANSGMREWRRNQMARAVPAPVQVPAAIMEAQATLARQVWQAAQAVAGESLAVAQAAWDAERSQLESLNREMADAFEVQAAELEALNGRMRAVAEQAESAASAAASLAEEVGGLRIRLAASESDARREAARVEEVGRRADELRRELDRSHQELAAAHAGGREAMRAHAEELAAVRADARQAEVVLREELVASRQQQHELMQIVSGAAAPVFPGDARYNDKEGP